MIKQGKYENTVEVTLTKKDTPLLFKRKLEELMEQNAFDSEEEAKKWIESTPVVLCLAYQKHSGLFAVEDTAVDCTVSPYDGVTETDTIVEDPKTETEENAVNEKGTVASLRPRVGDTIRIIKVQSSTTLTKAFPDGIDHQAEQLNGRYGIVEHIDSAGGLFGQWGGMSILPEDEIEIVKRTRVPAPVIEEIMRLKRVESARESIEGIAACHSLNKLINWLEKRYENE